MKNPYLALEFREKGTVCVLQSARYINSNDMEEVVRECHEDARFFQERGFNVVREKIESSIFGIQGVPRRDDEVLKYPTKYFEFHIRVHRADHIDDSEPIAEDEIKQLVELSRKVSEDFQIPVPLSWNVAKSQQGIHQRFLNLRFRGIGSEKARTKVEAVQKMINNTVTFAVGKVISEYVWYDSYPKMDVGWID